MGHGTICHVPRPPVPPTPSHRLFVHIGTKNIPRNTGNPIFAHGLNHTNLINDYELQEDQ